MLGRGHSFPAICDQDDEHGTMMSLLPNMNRVPVAADETVILLTPPHLPY